MAAVEEINYSKAAYVDYQYEYLQKHKLEGSHLEELRRRQVGQTQKTNASRK
jgi:hypothetical protein